MAIDRYWKRPFKTAHKSVKRRALILAALCFCIIFCAVILMNLEAPRQKASVASQAPAYKPVAAEGLPPVEAEGARPAAPPAAPAALASAVPPNSSTVSSADAASLALKGLIVPVQGVTPDKLRDSFYDGRSEGRVHEALDIMAAQGTPVLAVADGTVVRLFQSAKGGITLYQMDPSGLYVYYYAHLSRYADGMAEGKTVKRGEVIGYVGDTGNAGAGNFHLHFSINKITAPGKWSGGEPINPYPLLTGKPEAAISGR